MKIKILILIYIIFFNYLISSEPDNNLNKLENFIKTYNNNKIDQQVIKQFEYLYNLQDLNISSIAAFYLGNINFFGSNEISYNITNAKRFYIYAYKNAKNPFYKIESALALLNILLNLESNFNEVLLNEIIETLDSIENKYFLINQLLDYKYYLAKYFKNQNLKQSKKFLTEMLENQSIKSHQEIQLSATLDLAIILYEENQNQEILNKALKMLESVYKNSLNIPESACYKVLSAFHLGKIHFLFLQNLKKSTCYFEDVIKQSQLLSKSYCSEIIDIKKAVQTSDQYLRQINKLQIS